MNEFRDAGVVLLMTLLTACAAPGDAPEFSRNTLKVLTYNVWHGLNPTGLIRFSEYETAEERDTRYRHFLDQVRRLDPDVLLLQETNPAPVFTARLARDLGYDRVFSLDNGGLRVGSVGLPTNLRSGLAILARKDLRMEDRDKRKLSGPPGFTNRWLCFQLAEFRYGLAAKIHAGNREILILNTHLHHGIVLSDKLRRVIDGMVEEGVITRDRADEIAAALAESTARRLTEIDTLMNFADEHGARTTPVIMGGDFNAEPETQEIQTVLGRYGFTRAMADDPATGPQPTWDYERNENTHRIADFKFPLEFEPEVDKRLRHYEIGLSRRLDYVFYRDPEKKLTVQSSGLFGTEEQNGRHASDHFGVFAVFTLD
ncbi:MAG: endonuclease/exonuclease/phosphatase family protein [Deltaproteobacteria bacterium]|nr:endonuclease/exonuclease/phosphatase family protein [Deltaproteobacteria bacterium]